MEVSVSEMSTLESRLIDIKYNDGPGRNGTAVTRRPEPLSVRVKRTNMFFFRNRLHTELIRWHRNVGAGRAFSSRHYVQPAHTRPALAASVTPVEKILLDTIKVHASRIFPILEFSVYLNTNYSIGKWTSILRNVYATLPLSPNRGLLYET
jgi:hypothetical protein